MKLSAPHWTNPSVLLFASGHDPVAMMTERARSVIFRAMQEGWVGPPFDPFRLAELLKMRVVPREDINDARIFTSSQRSVSIEYNPNRPKARIRYSICHEIAHSFFADFAQRARYRLTTREMSADEWQLEMLCNLGAAELLMPVGMCGNLMAATLSMDDVFRLRKKFEVSTEAVLLRAVNVTSRG